MPLFLFRLGSVNCQARCPNQPAGVVRNYEQLRRENAEGETVLSAAPTNVACFNRVFKIICRP